MPFTVSHAIVAFPLKRWLPRLPLDALILGATMPDLDYLINFRDDEKHWHSFDGLIVALPVCLLLIVFWRRVVYPAILVLFPNLKSSVPDRLRLPLVYTIVAALLGIITHILWDAITHYDGWFVEKVPDILLRRTPIKPSYAWLQDLSSIVGLSYILYRTWKTWRKYREEFDTADRKRLRNVIVALSAICLAGGLFNGWLWRDEMLSMMLGHAAYGIVLSFVAAVAIWSTVILIKWREPRNKSTTTA